LQVSDLERALAYYQHVLGLRLLDQSAGTARLGTVESGRVLVELAERPGAHPVPRRGVLGLYHFAILVPERRSLGRLVRHVLRAGPVPGMADHAVSEAVYLTDPDGLGIEVYADRPRAEWRADPNGQLHMTTDPLDVDDLLEAAGDEPWTGMPTGTVIGHVHLHVGDLERAEDFYHQALGLDKVVWTYPGALFMSAGGYHHHLGTNTWSSGPPAADDQARLLFWDIEVPEARDAEQAANSLTARGFTVARDGDALSAMDPWGTKLRIVSATK